MKRVIIVGGGITGLAAAYTLEKRKQDVEYLLLEKERRLGGKIITERKDGFLVEGGPDCYLAAKPSVTQLAQEVGLSHRLIGTNDEHKGTFVFSEGRLHTLPEGLMMLVPTKIIPFALSPLISWPGKFRMALDFVLPSKKNNYDETLKSFVLRRLGQEALDKIAEPLIGGIHGGDPDTMSLRASFPRFLDMEQKYGSLVRAMLAARKRAPQARSVGPKTGPSTFFVSFQDGMGELVEGIRGQLHGRIIEGCAVTSFKKQGSGYRVKVSGGEEFDSDALILAVPAPQAAELLSPLDEVAAQNLSAIPMASSATVSLGYRRDQIPFPLTSFGFMIPHVEGRKINAVTYTSVKWHYRVPGEDHVLLRTFLGGAKNSPLAHADDSVILSWVKEEFRDILGITAEPVMTGVHHWLNARPQYTLGHLDRIALVEERIQKFPGLFLAGASYRGIGVPDCVTDGIKAAEKTLELLTT
ncbi:MAG: protoporphyrinogen oxidase [Desulfitobacteriaceae bacterium]|nr:protoporphyrinogen oxidase [Desulfitobacteriaceae bacterium]